MITACSWICGSKQDSSNDSSWAKSSLLLVFVNNVLLDHSHVTPLRTSRVPFTLQGWSKLNGCDRDSLAWKGEYICYLVFYKSLLTPGLNCASGRTQSKLASVGHVGQRKVSGYWNVEGAELSGEDYLENSRHLYWRGIWGHCWKTHWRDILAPTSAPVSPWWNNNHPQGSF